MKGKNIKEKQLDTKSLTIYKTNIYMQYTKQTV